MAHASQLLASLDMYTKHFVKEQVWKKYTEYLYVTSSVNYRVKNVLYGRLCLAQQLRFFVALRVENDSFIRVKFWREDPQNIGETLGKTASFHLSLFEALDMFPELHDTELFENLEEGWCMQNTKK